MKPHQIRSFGVVVYSLVLSATLITPAYAYLDPASGSALTAAVLGFFATIVYVARKQFYRFIRLFKSKPASEK
jgi:hypothetical protein